MVQVLKVVEWGFLFFSPFFSATVDVKKSEPDKTVALERGRYDVVHVPY